MRLMLLICKGGITHHGLSMASGEQVSRRMLRVALENPLNQRFFLVSEVCIPMYPPTVVYATLMGEDKARINACLPPGWHTQSERCVLQPERSPACVGLWTCVVACLADSLLHEC